MLKRDVIGKKIVAVEQRQVDGTMMDVVSFTLSNGSRVVFSGVERNGETYVDVNVVKPTLRPGDQRNAC